MFVCTGLVDALPKLAPGGLERRRRLRQEHLPACIDGGGGGDAPAGGVAALEGDASDVEPTCAEGMEASLSSHMRSLHMRSLVPCPPMSHNPMLTHVSYLSPQFPKSYVYARFFSIRGGRPRNGLRWHLSSEQPR